jgi:hypothetical protein
MKTEDSGMNEDLENRLRRALRPVDVPEGFTERLMSRLPQERKPPVVVALPAPAPRRSRNFALPSALAASLVAAVMLGQYVADVRVERETAAGRAASRELMQALRVTSQKLDLAYEAVNNPRSSAGEEENPS